MKGRGEPTLQEALAVIARLTKTGRKSLTVQQLWNLYEPVASRQKEGYWPSVASRWKHVLAFFGHRNIADLTLADVDAYREHRAKEIAPLTGRAYSPGSRNLEVAALRAAITFGVKRGYLDANPLTRVEMEPQHDARSTVICEADLQRILSKLSKVLAAIVLMAYDTGCRRGELLRLRWEQVDLETGRVWIPGQHTKTRQGRHVRLTGRVRTALAGLTRTPWSPYVFYNGAAAWSLSKTALHHHWCAAVIAAKVSGARGEFPRFHDLRRAYVTHARRRGIPESVVMRTTGHRTRSVFDRYNVIGEGDLDEALARMEQGIATETAKAVRP